MAYRLRHGLHFCVSDGRAIFFDVPGDRYFGLRPEWDNAFQRCIAREDTGPELEALIDAGIIMTAGDSAELLQPASIAMPAREIEQVPVFRSLIYGPKCLMAQVRAVLLLRFRSFEHVVDKFLLPVSAPNCEDQALFAAVATAFAATAPFRPRGHHCLSNSIAFLQVVRGLGLNATLVIGVSAQPFAAHCWVQSGEVLLNDRLENIRPFQPIFSI